MKKKAKILPRERLQGNGVFIDKEYKRIICEKLLQFPKQEGYNMTRNDSLEGANPFSAYSKPNSNTNKAGL